MKINYSNSGKLLYENCRNVLEHNSSSVSKFYIEKSLDNIPTVHRDEFTISDCARQIVSNYKQMSSISSVNGSEIQDLKTENNILNFKVGSLYAYESAQGREAILGSYPSGVVIMPFEELGMLDGTVSPAVYGATNRIEKFFTYLATDRTGLAVNLSYTEEEQLEILSNVGIKPGIFTINSGEESNKFCLLSDGKIRSYKMSEGTRMAHNGTNWFGEGFKKGDIFEIDGKEYKVDETGYIHIPEGVVCLAATMKNPDGVSSYVREYPKA